VGMNPQPSMENPASDGPMKAEIEAPSAKVAKLRCASFACAVRADEVVDRDVEEDVAQATRVAHAMSAGNPLPASGTSRPRASITAPPTMGFVTPIPIRDPSRVDSEHQREGAKSAASTPTWSGVAPRSSAESDTSILAPRMLTPCSSDSETAM